MLLLRSSRQLGRSRPGWAALGGSLMGVGLMACNTLFGIDDLSPGDDPTTSTSAIPTTSTTSSTGGAGGSTTTTAAGGAGGGGGAAGGGAQPGPATFRELGYETSSAGNHFNDSVTVTLTEPAAADEWLVAMFAGRGTGPLSIEDSRGLAWTEVVSQTNASQTATVAVYQTVLVSDLELPVTVDVVATDASPYPRALLVLAVSGVSAVVDTSTTESLSDIDITGSQPVLTTGTLVFALTATGFNSPVAFSSTESTALHTFGGDYASGAFFTGPSPPLGRPATFHAMMSSFAAAAGAALVVYSP